MLIQFHCLLHMLPLASIFDFVIICKSFTILLKPTTWIVPALYSLICLRKICFKNSQLIKLIISSLFHLAFCYCEALVLFLPLPFTLSIELYFCTSLSIGLKLSIELLLLNKSTKHAKLWWWTLYILWWYISSMSQCHDNVIE